MDFKKFNDMFTTKKSYVANQKRCLKNRYIRDGNFHFTSQITNVYGILVCHASIIGIEWGKQLRDSMRLPVSLSRVAKNLEILIDIKILFKNNLIN